MSLPQDATGLMTYSNEPTVDRSLGPSNLLLLELYTRKSQHSTTSRCGIVQCLRRGENHNVKILLNLPFDLVWLIEEYVKFDLVLLVTGVFPILEQSTRWPTFITAFAVIRL